MIEKITKLDKVQYNKVYANPTIAEALCEIHFDNSDYQNSANEAILKSLKTELSADYPSVTEQQIKQFKAAITEMGISVKEEKSNTTRLIFKHRERNHMIQFLPTILTINEVGRYPGWDFFLQDVSRGCTALNSGFHSICAKRIGLRYINLIPRRNHSEPISEWLKPNIYYPTAILSSSSGFMARNEFDLNKDIRLIVTLSESMQKDTRGSIVFDIDVLSPLKGEKMDWNTIRDHLEKLHNMVWEVFSTSLSKKYETLLNGELL